MPERMLNKAGWRGPPNQHVPEYASLVGSTLTWPPNDPR